MTKKEIKYSTYFVLIGLCLFLFEYILCLNENNRANLRNIKAKSKDF